MKKVSTKRRDSKGRILQNGESQMADGRYRYSYYVSGKQKNLYLSLIHISEIATAVKNSAYEIINKKHATYYGIAMSVKRICEVIMRDEKSILPVSHMIHGVYDLSLIHI